MPASSRFEQNHFELNLHSHCLREMFFGWFCLEVLGEEAEGFATPGSRHPTRSVNTANTDKQTTLLSFL